MKQAWVLLICCLLLWPMQAEAAQTIETDLLELDEFGIEDLEKSLREMEETKEVSFKEYARVLLKGEIPVSAAALGTLAKKAVLSELTAQKKLAVQILILAIGSAVILNFVWAFGGNQTADIGFFVIFLFLSVLLMTAFAGMTDILETAQKQVTGFMTALIPSYFAASVFASNGMRGIAFYEFTFGLLGALQWLMKVMLLPMAEGFVILKLLDQLTEEELLAKLAELLKLILEWSLKTIMAVSFGLQAVQNMVLPAVDHLKTAVINKTASVIPGVGNLFGGVTEVVLGSAVLLKGAIGAAGMLILVLLCLTPLVKLLVCTLLYKVMAAILQPVCKKQIGESLDAVAEGAALLLKIMLTAFILFFMTIAMVTSSVGG